MKIGKKSHSSNNSSTGKSTGKPADYIKYIGETGQFSRTGDKKTVEGVLVAINNQGFFAQVKGIYIPQFFENAHFGKGHSSDSFICPNCKCQLTIVQDNKKTGNKKDNNYGIFTGKKARDKAKTLIELIDAIKAGKLDSQDDDDYAEIVEVVKSLNG